LTTEEYFGMIINILMGLTLIVFAAIFLYMVYCEKEEKPLASTRSLMIGLFQKVMICLQRLYILV